MSSDSGLGDCESTVDSNPTNGNDLIIPHSETGVPAFVPSSAENSAAVKSTTEEPSAEKAITMVCTPENFTSDKSATMQSLTEASTMFELTSEKFTAETSGTEESSSDECSSDESTTENSAEEDSTVENSTAVGFLTQTNSGPDYFRKLSPEILNKIIDYTFPEPSSACGGMPLTRTFDPPVFAQLSKVLRQTVWVMYYHERDFCIQVPRDDDSRKKIESLQFDLMERWNLPPYPGHANKVKELLEEEAEEVADKFEDCIEGLEATDPINMCHSLIKSIRVWSGRFRINRTTFTYNWAPSSFIVGFKAFSGPPRHGQRRRAECRINADGTLDWKDFNRVRMIYTKMLRTFDGDFGSLKFEDVLLHPSVQHIVKQMCLLGVAKAPAMEWVEVMVEEWDSWSTRKELGMPDYEPDSVDDISPPPSAAASPLPSDNEWWEEEEEEVEEEEPEEESEQESEHELEEEDDEGESALPGHGDELQD